MRQQELINVVKGELGEAVTAINWGYDLGDSVNGKTYVAVSLRVVTEDGGAFIGKDVGIIEGDHIDLNEVQFRDGFTTAVAGEQARFRVGARGGDLDKVLEAVKRYLRAYGIIGKQVGSIKETVTFNTVGE